MQRSLRRARRGSKPSEAHKGNGDGYRHGGFHAENTVTERSQGEAVGSEQRPFVGGPSPFSTESEDEGESRRSKSTQERCRLVDIKRSSRALGGQSVQRLSHAGVEDYLGKKG